VTSQKYPSLVSTGITCTGASTGQKKIHKN
jgi:hypothetical protein